MDNEITPEDELKAENELLKLKLEMEHGMSDLDNSKLPADLENQWLNNIYNFERLHKEAGRVKVLAFIGNPIFTRLDELSNDQVSLELNRIQEIMKTNGVNIDFICEYEDDVKYRFITEELFQEEIDDIRIEGMMSCFIYEEFHPNHDYDLRRQSTDFLRYIFKKTWTEECARFEMTKKVMFRGNEYDGAGISQVIFSFLEVTKEFDVKKEEVKEVSFDLNDCKGHVLLKLSYTQYCSDGSRIEHTGDCNLFFVSEYGGWSLSEFSLPGLGV